MTLPHTPPARQYSASDLARDTLSDKWDAAKREAEYVSWMYAAHPDERIRKWGARIASCASLITYEWMPPRDGGRWRRRLVSTRLCRVRTCPICRWRRSLQLQADTLDTVRRLTADGSLRPVLLTLTVRNPELSELRDTLKAMTRAWSKLTRRIVWRGVAGWVRSIEITPGTISGHAHPHLHALLLVDESWTVEQMDRQLWSAEWRDVAALNYEPVVDIRPITSDGGVIEALKYSVKPGDGSLDPQWLPAVALAMDRVRLYACGGVISVAEPVSEEEYETREAGHEVDAPPAVPGHPHIRHGVQILYGWESSRRAYRRQSCIVYHPRHRVPPPYLRCAGVLLLRWR